MNQNKDLQADLQKINNIDLVQLAKKIEQQKSEKPYYLNHKLNYVTSHRKGFLGKIVNAVLKKFFTATHIFIENLILQQEKFNKLTYKKFKQLNPYQNLDLDYKKFEDKFRGSKELITERQTKYLPYFKDCKNVLDLGCGRGEFLKLLQKNNIYGVGVEIDKKMYEHCKSDGLEVYNQDMFRFLNSNNSSVDGIFCSQVIEHLLPQDLIKLINLCHKNLNKGGIIIVETINLQSLITFTSSIYADLSHQKPIHPDTLEFLLESAGFSIENRIYSSEMPEHIKLSPITATTPNDEVLNQNLQKLNNILFGPGDYAIIAKK